MTPQLINVVLGLWTMAAPALLSYGRPAAANDYVVGPLVATFACIALWEATRPVRWINLPLGLWLISATWALDYPATAQWNCVLVGMGIAAMACLGGRVTQRFGGGWAALWRGVPE
jgi:hypothetical protein